MTPQDRNPQMAQPGWPPVVVAGLFQTGINLMRDLKRRGLKVYGIDHNLSQPGFSSIYGTTFECPNPDERPDDWLAFMVALAGRIGARPVLIPSADVFVSAMACHAAKLAAGFHFCHAAAPVQGQLATKERQYELAGRFGLEVPRTRMVSSMEEVRAFAADARCPCLMKPVHFREWEQLAPGHPFYGKKIAVARSAKELVEKYDLVARHKPQAVIQEVIEGPDTAKLVYLSCYGVDGSRLAACMVRELRTDPIHFGSASVVEPVTDADADALCDGFLRGIGYSGICEIELKRDSRDGRVKMIEANPRYSVTADAAPYAGVALGWLHYLDLIGQPVEPVTQDHRNFRHIVLSRDFATIRSYRRAEGLTWRALIQSYRRPVHFFDFDPRDWRVTVRTALVLARLLAGPPIRRLFPRMRVRQR